MIFYLSQIQTKKSFKLDLICIHGYICQLLMDPLIENDCFPPRLIQMTIFTLCLQSSLPTPQAHAIDTFKTNIIHGLPTPIRIRFDSN